MQNITWDVRYSTPPLVLKYCKKCRKKMKHVSSGRFRVNAQGKYLDIWLIYKCTACQTTWNLPLYSRITPESIPCGLLDRFYGNDETLALQYAFSTSLLQENGAEIVLPDYQVSGPLPAPGAPVRLQIKSRYSLPVKVTSVLCQKLKLSRRELEKIMNNGRIQNISPKELKKCRLNQGVTIYLEETIPAPDSP